MAEITHEIQPQGFELVRDRIASILATELPVQGAFDPNINVSKVYLERWVPIDPTETPLVNVLMERGDPTQQTAKNTQGEYTYNIDVYAGAATDATDAGDKKAFLKVQKLMGIIRAILEDPKYKKLGFDDVAFIMNRHVSQLLVSPPQDAKDAGSLAMGRVVFVVRIPETVELQEGVLVSEFSTSVKLYETDKGFVFSGEDIPTPPITGAEIQINGDFLADVNAGDLLNIQVLNSEENPVGTPLGGNRVDIGDGTVNLVDANGDPLGTVSVPAETTVVETVASVTEQINGTTIGTSVPGSTNNQVIENSDGDPVGTDANPSVVSDVQIQVNGANTETAPAETIYNQQVKNSNNDDVGTSANPSVVGDTTIRNQANDWNDTEKAEGTYTLPLGHFIDTDQSTPVPFDYKPTADGTVGICTPADYGTLPLSRLRREFSAQALCGFSGRYISDEWESAGNPVYYVYRSGDGLIQGFTPAQIIGSDSTDLVPWVVSGGGTERGTIVYYPDQEGNGFVWYETVVGNQDIIVDGGVLQVDSNGKPFPVIQSANGYKIGADGSSNAQLTLFTEAGAFWCVGKKGNSTTISRVLSAGGNPAVGIADTTSNPNALNTGSPSAYVNSVALADQQRDTLQTAINDTEHILFMEDCDWTDSANWRINQTITAFQNYQSGSAKCELVIGKKDWSTADIRDMILTDTQDYYDYP